MIKDIMIGVDVGLLVYILFLYLKLRRTKLKEKINEVLMENLLENKELKNKVIGIQNELIKKSNNIKPSSDLLRTQLKYTMLFLITYNFMLAIIFLLK